MNIVHLLVATIATWQIVEIWHHSYLFEKLRARAESLDNWLGNLLSCPFCLAVWVAAFCVLVFYIVEGLVGGGHTWTHALGLPLYMLAVSRLANLGNDLSHEWCRTPGSSVMEETRYGPMFDPPEITEVPLSEWHREMRKDPDTATITVKKVNEIMKGDYELATDDNGYFYLYRGTDWHNSDGRPFICLARPEDALEVYNALKKYTAVPPTDE
jgi:hypothetical protein